MPEPTPTQITEPTAETRPTLLYGGTFDPPHVAHAALPLLAAEAIDADTLLYLPAGRSPFKQGRKQSAPHRRLAMLERLLDTLRPHTDLALRIDNTEAQRGDDAPTYTVDTVRRLHDERPGVPLRLLVGTDQFLLFPQWHEAEALAELAPPVVMVRPPETLDRVETFLRDEAPPWMREAKLLELPAMDVSSSELREAIRNGRDVSGQVAPAVLEYAREHRLYA